MLRKIKFAVVGCGHIGKRHAEMIQQNPQCELVALVDNKPKDSLSIEKYLVDFFLSLEDLLSSNIEVDVVVIATPNGLHYEQSKACLISGKHIVVEKPIALEAEQVVELINLSKECEKHIFPVMQNRYSPPAQWIKGIIEENILGEIFLVHINCFWNRDERYYTPNSWHGSKDLDGGTLYTQFSHFIDIMVWLFGDIQNIKARFADFNHKNLTDFEDSGVINFEFKKGGVGSFNYSTSVYNQNLESSLTIIAENGSVKIGGQYMDKVEMCNIKDYTLPTLAPTQPLNDYGLYKGSAQNHQYVIENVVKVLHRGENSGISAEESFTVIDIIERIYNLKSTSVILVSSDLTYNKT